ncbi:tripartite tricarboxylate transporter substrate-binding protein [Sediminicoccus sp. KRV36]|uniref:Bug family tripartite tricarboxylate transporter substrate binding protein n=1 Tax=Sediminicoccus sp. KRV36 TaxID=3133721 RepID=UPI00200E072A|nr:tripartite tricarboxylate transporter substrate-binding protein [Sediminicoccus rosea]UPY35693.1 tripartite tricarboxylate transporter substrate binding protein [Sediminicoccus rosea]
MSLRRALTAGLLALAPAVLAEPAAAFPERPIRLVVPFAAGGATDVGARVLAEAMSAHLSQPIVVENRVGGAGIVASEVVARAAADGHTLLINNTSHAVLRLVVPNAPIDVTTALTAVSVLSEMPMVMLVANNHPARDVREFITMARAAPGRFDYGSTGGGGTLQMAALLFLQSAGLDLNEIPYRGGAPATLDLAAGRIAMVFDVALTGVQTARGGQARAFAVTSAGRSPALPEVPSLREIGLDAEMNVWQAIFAASSTPAPIQAALHRAIAAAMGTEAMARRMAELGVDRILASRPEAAQPYVAAEVARWEGLLRGRINPAR